ncbi:12117_t:CDS:2, partial [Dentiscutata erythropus]
SCGSHLVVKSYTVSHARTASFLRFSLKGLLSPIRTLPGGLVKNFGYSYEAPTVTCVIEDDTLTNHSEELRLSHKLLWFMIGCQECVLWLNHLLTQSFYVDQATIVTCEFIVWNEAKDSYFYTFDDRITS